MIYVLLGVGTTAMQLEQWAKPGSLDLLYLKEGHGGLGGSRAIPFVFREIRVANREERTYPYQIRIGCV